ncbi:MAG: glycosyltransferase [Desulfobacteraceae bacterium]|nr:MAG: glycosyltransferase [Desulfobacteraceae bacterium]
MKPSYKILMILPQEFMAYHGSGIQVRNRLKAILDKGNCTVDLLTLPLGKDIRLEHLKIFRVFKIPYTSSDIEFGPSLKKYFYDMALCFYSFALASRKSYDLVYTHEESGLIGAFVRAIFGIPHVHEMHSFLPQGMCNYGACKEDDIIYNWTCRLERFILGHSDQVIAISPDIANQSTDLCPRANITTIENCFIEGERELDKVEAELLRRQYNPDSRPLVVYTGNLSDFQGVDVLLESILHVKKVIPDILLMIVGLSELECVECMKWGERNEAERNVLPVPRRPVEDVPLFLNIADCLVSPRKKGSNTPYKLYAYMAAEKPIVATRNKSHLTAISEREAFLVETNPVDMARGIITALKDPVASLQKAGNAKQLYSRRFAFESFCKSVQNAIETTLKDRHGPYRHHH